MRQEESLRTTCPIRLDLTSSETAQMFQDVPVGQADFVQIDRIAVRGIMTGFPCGGPGEPCGPNSLPYFRPDAPLSSVDRIDYATILINTFLPGCPAIATPTVTVTSTATPTSSPSCGLAWRAVTSPNAGSGESYLDDVAAVSPTDIWAVGYYDITDGEATFIVHWDGTMWSVVPSPDTTDNVNELIAVTAISADDLWAVGAHGFIQPGDAGLIVHWDGSVWSIVSSPAGTESLADVTALSSNNVWAVGGFVATATIHWDGTQWSTVSSPNPGDYENSLSGITAVASNDLWAVGISYSGGCCAGQTLTLHWDGIQWNDVSSPNLGGYSSRLNAVESTATDNVWAVGDADAPTGNQHQTLVEHWDGTAWTIVNSPSPGPDSNYLHNIRAVTADDIWAVGEYSSGSFFGTLILHWNGSLWSVSSSPSPGEIDNGLSGVAAVSANDVWTVGYQYGVQNAGTLTLRYSDPCATSTPTPASTGTSTPTTVPATTTAMPTSTQAAITATSDNDTYTYTYTYIYAYAHCGSSH